MPEWIFKLKKIDKKERKHLEKFPVKRESISTKIEKNVDPNIKWEMTVRDKIFHKRMKKMHKEEKIMNEKEKQDL